MYSPSAYYLAGWLASTLTLVFYPLLCGSISFYFLDFHDDGYENFFRWLASLLLFAVQGSTYGFLFGCVIDNEEAGINWLQYSDMVYLFGSGFYVNLKTANWLIKAIGYTSPFRYSTERLLRILLKGRPIEDEVCSSFDFELKEWCLYLAAIFLGIYFIVGWIAIVIRARKGL
jgi:ABC-type multidrug transport system permease subunit